MKARRRGNSIIEVGMWMPFILLILVGMVQIGKITYVYYTVKKVLYGIAMQLATSQGVNFCDSEDPLILSAKNYALSGGIDTEGVSLLPALTPDLIDVSTECVDASTGAPGPCALDGCDTPGGGIRPDYVIVSLPSGYEVAPRFPYMLTDPILLRPEVRVPYGGT